MYTLVLCIVVGAHTTARAELIDGRIEIEGTRVRYQAVLPDDYDPDQAYPAILVLGGGPQTMQTIEGALARNFRAEAEARGFIVIGPAAPDDELFFRGGDRVIPGFLDAMRAEYSIRAGNFHVAGPSNGGIAAMHLAAKYPDEFISATAFPGYLWQPTAAKLDALDGICVFLYVGENDTYRWHEEMEREAAYLRSRGTRAAYTVEAGQSHRIETLAGAGAARLFDGFEQAERGCRL